MMPIADFKMAFPYSYALMVLFILNVRFSLLDA
jgi:hypothetical protein